MTINDSIKLIAGSFVLASIILGYFYNQYFFLFTGFVGLNLIQSSFTKWCLMEKIVKKFGVKEGGDSCSI
jgi:H+/gluconate symporter-like permease